MLNTQLGINSKNMNSRNLLIFSYDYPPSNGGIARLCQEIAVGMEPYYQSITVLTRRKTGISKPYNYDSVKIVELPSKRLFCEIAAWWYLLNIRDKGNIDILCGVWHPEATLCLMAGLKKINVLTHGTELLSGGSKFRRSFWLPKYGKRILGKVRKVISNSNYTKDLTLKVNPKANVIALPLGVNKDFFKPLPIAKDNSKLKLCTVSRVLQFKGHDFIAQTIAGLPEDIKSIIEWNVAGTGPYLNDLKALVKDLKIEDQVSFKGFVPDEQLPVFYNQNDVFILCTRESLDSTQVEGFGLVFLEAQSCGLPAIGTSTGGIPDALKHNNGGWLIEQDNKKELSDLLIQLVKGPYLIKEQSEKARKRVLNDANWDVYCKELQKILSE